MPAKDTYHQVVKRALEKAGWLITHDPLVIQVDQRKNVYIDLGAKHLLSAEKGEQKIAVEIKSFIGKSFNVEFYTALGQFITYRGILAEKEPERKLYLAIPRIIYKNQFQARFIELAIQNSLLKYLVYDIDAESIYLWQN